MKARFLGNLTDDAVFAFLSEFLCTHLELIPLQQRLLLRF